MVARTDKRDPSESLSVLLSASTQQDLRALGRSLPAGPIVNCRHVVTFASGWYSLYYTEAILVHTASLSNGLVASDAVHSGERMMLAGW
jgi:hypothetical protein